MESHMLQGPDNTNRYLGLLVWHMMIVVHFTLHPGPFRKLWAVAAAKPRHPRWWRLNQVRFGVQVYKLHLCAMGLYVLLTMIHLDP